MGEEDGGGEGKGKREGEGEGGGGGVRERERGRRGREEEDVVRRRPLAYSFKHESLIVPEGVRGLDLLCVVLVSHGISRESIHLCFNVTVSVLPGQKEPRNDLWTRMKEARVRDCANVLVHKGLDEMDGTVHQETAENF